MDKLAKRLRQDADDINVDISDELDRRIEASLHAVTPATERQAPRARPPLFWVASTVTGAVAALAIIAVINLQSTPEEPAVAPATVAELPPTIDLNMQPAMLTAPLQQELENLQSDLRKAEEKVKREIGL